MDTPLGYVICATPRTGSTFLCRLLSGTEALGRPESYFREPDEVTLAQRFGLPTQGTRVLDYQVFARTVRVVATTPNGTFGARIMWGALPRMRHGLEAPPHQSDVEALQEAFGPLRFVHLQRRDVIAQAVSWARAEQTGYWQEGDHVQGTPEADVDRMMALVRMIRDDNAAWRLWFDRNEVEPCELAYEDLTRNPEVVLQEIAELVGIVAPVEQGLGTLPRQQADHVNAQWSALVRSALARSDH